MRYIVAFVILLLGFVTAASAEPADNALLGHWTGVSANAKGTSFEFRPDGSATWNLQQTQDFARSRRDSTS